MIPGIPHYSVSVAPMMGCTDRHFRYMARLFSPSVLLYTEMISAAAIIHGNSDKLLSFHPKEHPLALQIGSGDIHECARAVSIAERHGYDEYNLNVGCPSPKVQHGLFGAQLMTDPHRVADIVRAMKSVTDKPVTVKHRLGVSRDYDRNALLRFCEIVAAANPDRLIAHARVALLEGLSPKENRSIPPIMHKEVYQLKQHFPHIPIELNGEVSTVDSIEKHLLHVDGVMIGRESYRNPRMLLEIEQRVFGSHNHTAHSAEIVQQLLQYIDECEHSSIHISPHLMSAHLSALYYCQPKAKKWRRALHDEVNRQNTLSEFTRLRQALQAAHQAVNLLHDEQ